jgi:hypothetical protein
MSSKQRNKSGSSEMGIVGEGRFDLQPPHHDK